MAAGDRWRMPGAHEALELPGSTRDALRLSVIDPAWRYPKQPQMVARVLCELMPSRYLNGAIPKESK